MDEKNVLDNESRRTREASWRAWKKMCAAGLCDAESEADLRKFGAARCFLYMRRYGSQAGGAEHQNAEHGWHLLETHAAAATDRRGKRYKDWLFTRADMSSDWLSAVESGASLLMRDAVRENLRRECSPAWMTSIQQPLPGGDSSPLTLEDLLPDSANPSDEAAEREWNELARALAVETLPHLTECERMVIWARGEGLTLNDPGLSARTGASASILYKTHRAAVENICSELKNRYHDTSAACLVHLAGLILQELHRLISKEKSLQKTDSGFFKES